MILNSAFSEPSSVVMVSWSRNFLHKYKFFDEQTIHMTFIIPWSTKMPSITESYGKPSDKQSRDGSKMKRNPRKRKLYHNFYLSYDEMPSSATMESFHRNSTDKQTFQLILISAEMIPQWRRCIPGSLMQRMYLCNRNIW